MKKISAFNFTRLWISFTSTYAGINIMTGPGYGGTGRGGEAARGGRFPARPSTAESNEQKTVILHYNGLGKLPLHLPRRPLPTRPPRPPLFEPATPRTHAGSGD